MKVWRRVAMKYNIKHRVTQNVSDNQSNVQIIFTTRLQLAEARRDNTRRAVKFQDVSFKLKRRVV